MNDASPLQRTIAPQAAFATDAGAPVAAGMARIASKVDEFAQAQINLAANKELADARLSATKQLDDLKSQYDQDMGDPLTAAQRFSDDAAKIGDQVAGSMNFGQARDAFMENYGRMAEAGRIDIKYTAVKKQKDDLLATGLDSMDTFSRTAAVAKNPQERDAVVQQADDTVKGLVSSGAISARDGAKMMMKWRGNLATYDARSAIDADPVAAVKALRNPDVLPDLDPLERQREIERGEAEIKSREREARAALRDMRIDAREAVGELEDVTRLGLPVSQSAYDNARNLVSRSGDRALADRFMHVAQVSNFVTGLRGASRQEIAGVVSTLEEQAQKNGANGALAAGIDAARKFQAAQESGLRTDPLGYAQAQGRVQVPPLALNGSDSADAWKARISAAEKTASWYRTRPTYLTRSESDQLAGLLSPDQPANTRLSAAKMLISGLGSRAASVFSDLSKNDPVIGQAGILLLNGNPKAAADALNGQKLLHSATDGKQSDLRPTPARKAMLNNPADQLLTKAVGPLMVGERGRMLSTADAIYASRAPQHGFTGASVGVNKDASALYNRAVQESAGATFDDAGNQYGGIGSYRGAPVIVPRGIAADQFEDAVHGLSDRALTTHSVTQQPPVLNGKPLSSRDLRRMYVITAGDGLYALSTTNPAAGVTIVHDASGAPYRFSITNAFDAGRRK